MTWASKIELRLTASQKRHLRLLSNAEAFDSESAASAYTLSALSPDFGVHAGTLASLWRLQLSDSRVKRLGGGSQMTVYWLTDRGAQALQDLTGTRAA